MSELAQTLQNLYGAYQAGEVIQAEIGIRSLLQLYPEQPDVLRLGALTALAVNQVVTADQRLSKAASLTPLTAEMANTRGNILKKAADWPASREAYQAAIKLDPNYQPAYDNLLDMYVQSEQPGQALTLLESGRDFGEMGEYARSQALTNLGKYEDALETLNAVNATRYADRMTLQRVVILSAMSRLDEMKETIGKLPIGSELFPKALGIGVNALEMRGLRSEALNMIAEYTVPSDTTPLTYIKGVQLLRRAEQNAASRALMDVAADKFDSNPEILGEMANFALSNGNAPGSCEIYQRALSVKPGDLSLMTGYAQAAIVAGNYTTAQKLIQSALGQAPNNQFLFALAATLQRASGADHTALYDYDRFVRPYDLDPPKGYADIGSFNAALKDALGRLHIYTGTPVNQSLRKGTQTDINLALVEDPVIQSFFDMVDGPLRDYMNRLPQDVQHPLCRRKRESYRIAGAWSVRLSESGHHVNHVHPMGWISSSYYVDIPPSVNETSKEGWIKFGESSLPLPSVGPEKFIQPKPGRLVLFPSYMWHGTVPFQGQETRLTLPFDVVPD